MKIAICVSQVIRSESIYSEEFGIPRYLNIITLLFLQRLGFKFVIYSKDGKVSSDYWNRKLGLNFESV